MKRKKMESKDQRFWVVSDPPGDCSPKFSPCFGVCDEDAGGIIAYFNDEDQAQSFADACILRNKVVVKVLPDEAYPDMYQEAIEGYGTLVCWHRRSNLGKVNYPNHEDFLSQVSEKAIKIAIYCYEHSGICLSTGPFSCPWDSGQVGVWVFEPEDIKSIHGNDTEESRKKIFEGVSSQIEYLNSILSGDIWYVSIEDGHGETIESCGGFVGSSAEDLENIKDNFEEKYHALIEQAWEDRF